MDKTTYVFAFDEATKAAYPDLANMRLTLGQDLPIPSTGDAMSFEPLAGEWFLVTQRQFAYDSAGKLKITMNLTRAS